MERTEDLRVFLRTAELGSFTQAAHSLGLPKANVSAAVMRLERSVGARLLHRTTRKVELTHDGRIFQERCRDLLADIDELATMFRRGGADVSGRLRVDMPVGVARALVIPKLARFMARHPRLEIELGSTDRRVDLIREGYDCVVRVGAPADGELIGKQVASLPIASCASPAYLKKHGTPRRPADLAKHRLIHYSPSFGTKPDTFEYFDGAAYQSLAMPASITVNNSDAYQSACLAGFGIIQSPRMGLEDHFAARRLVEILADYPAAPMPVHILFPHRRHLALRVRCFVDWLEEILAP
jgi:DNA-binding transcriptional LysR family regulator